MIHLTAPEHTVANKGHIPITPVKHHLYRLNIEWRGLTLLTWYRGALS